LDKFYPVVFAVKSLLHILSIVSQNPIGIILENSAKNLPEYLRVFSRLRTNRAKNWTELTCFQAPHKPLLLISVLDLFSQNLIKSNFIELSPILVEKFINYWVRIMPERKKGNIALPFFHLQNNGFWYLLPHPGKAELLINVKQVDSLGKLKRITCGARLADDLYELAKQDENCFTLKSSLAKAYFSPSAQKVIMGQTVLEEKSQENSKGQVNEFKRINGDQHFAESDQLFLREDLFDVVTAIYTELKGHGRPLHYEVINKIVLDRYPYFKFNSRQIVKIMRNHPEKFEWLDRGVYCAR